MMALVEPTGTPLTWLVLAGTVCGALLSVVSVWKSFSKDQQKDGADALIQQQHTDDIKALKGTVASHETTLATHSRMFEMLEKDAERHAKKLDENNAMLHRIAGKLDAR